MAVLHHRVRAVHRRRTYATIDGVAGALKGHHHTAKERYRVENAVELGGVRVHADNAGRARFGAVVAAAAAVAMKQQTTPRWGSQHAAVQCRQKRYLPTYLLALALSR